VIQRFFKKNCFFCFELIIFYVFYYFDVLMLKKLNKYYFNIFLNKIYFKK
jgi:hypothetical protein